MEPDRFKALAASIQILSSHASEHVKKMKQNRESSGCLLSSKVTFFWGYKLKTLDKSIVTSKCHPKSKK